GDPDRREALVTPSSSLQTSCSQYPFTDGHDQPGVFGESNKFGGRNESELRMLPTDQRFHSGNRQRIYGNLRLVIKQKLFILNCSPQTRFESQTPRGELVHVSRVKLVVCAT